MRPQSFVQPNVITCEGSLKAPPIVIIQSPASYLWKLLPLSLSNHLWALFHCFYPITCEFSLKVPPIIFCPITCELSLKNPFPLFALEWSLPLHCLHLLKTECTEEKLHFVCLCGKNSKLLKEGDNCVILTVLCRVFFPGVGLGGPPIRRKFCQFPPPHLTLVPVFGPRLVPPSRGSSPKIWKI